MRARTLLAIAEIMPESPLTVHSKLADGDAVAHPSITFVRPPHTTLGDTLGKAGMIREHKNRDRSIDIALRR